MDLLYHQNICWTKNLCKVLLAHYILKWFQYTLHRIFESIKALCNVWIYSKRYRVLEWHFVIFLLHCIGPFRSSLWFWESKFDNWCQGLECFVFEYLSNTNTIWKYDVIVFKCIFIYLSRNTRLNIVNYLHKGCIYIYIYQHTKVNLNIRHDVAKYQHAPFEANV